MQPIVQHQYGPADVLSITEIDLPAISDGAM
jgi:hypothetical protein